MQLRDSVRSIGKINSIFLSIMHFAERVFICCIRISVNGIM